MKEIHSHRLFHITCRSLGIDNPGTKSIKELRHQYPHSLFFFEYFWTQYSQSAFIESYHILSFFSEICDGIRGFSKLNWNDLLLYFMLLILCFILHKYNLKTILQYYFSEIAKQSPSIWNNGEISKIILLHIFADYCQRWVMSFPTESHFGTQHNVNMYVHSVSILSPCLCMGTST